MKLSRTVVLVGVNRGLAIIGTPPPIVINRPYSFTFSTLGGSGTKITFLISGDDLPLGINFTDNGDGTATLAGTTTFGGAYNIKVQAYDNARYSPVYTFVLIVDYLMLQLLMAQQLVQGIAVTGLMLVASGGVAPYTYATPHGSFPPPPGIAFDPVTGIATGTPTTLGFFAMDAQVTDADGNIFGDTFDMQVYSDLEVIDGTPGLAESGVNFSYQFLVAGGGITYAVHSGAIPPPYSLTAGGLLSGNVTLLAPPHTYNFVVRASQSGTVYVDIPCSLTVVAPVQLDPGALVFYSGVDLTQLAYVSNGQGPFTLSALANLPAWASYVFDQQQGILAVSGNPPPSTVQAVITNLVTGTLTDALGGTYPVDFGVTGITQQVAAQLQDSAGNVGNINPQTWKFHSSDSSVNVDVANVGGAAEIDMRVSGVGTTGVTPGTYGNEWDATTITVNAFGQITAIYTQRVPAVSDLERRFRLLLSHYFRTFGFVPEGLETEISLALQQR